MIKKIKGFTLIELIIVMGLMAMIMAALLNIMKPIRRTYVDSTLYESQRNAQSGITRYISESIRYSVSIGVYTKGASATYDVSSATGLTRNVNSVSDAATYFLDDVSGLTVANALPTTDPKKANAVKVAGELKKNLIPKVRIITIDNTEDAYTFNKTDCTGRILRNRTPDTATAVTNDWEDPTKSDYCRLALGAGYYGETDYTIRLENIANVGFRVTATSVPDSNIMPNTAVSTQSEALCQNLYLSTSANKDLFRNYAKELTTNSPAPFSETELADASFNTPIVDLNLFTDSTTLGGKTYIVYLTPEDLGY